MGIHHFWREPPPNNGRGLLILGQHYRTDRKTRHLSGLGGRPSGVEELLPPLQVPFGDHVLDARGLRRDSPVQAGGGSDFWAGSP